MSRRQDDDLKAMSPAQLRQEVMKLRSAIRWHRDLEENERCWHCDQQLYGRTLPEYTPAGCMHGDARRILRNCIGYVFRQQCVHFGCDGRRNTRRLLGRLLTYLFQEMTLWLRQHQKHSPHA